ncbi:hypothetical protein N431DRAFT_59019 [Stipitochalara longipes BDJ]|nr:hypothetical protein N431DRAFT_59019 [Stipitochalara longipes BDJ]
MLSVPNEPFPGSLNTSDSGSTKMSRNYGLHRPKRRDTSDDWVHDKYRADSPHRKENNAPSNGSRLPDHYDGHGMRRSTDSYKPSLDSSYYRDDTRDVGSYRPGSRDRQGYYDDGRYGVYKPTTYYTLLETLVKKAYAVGVSPKTFFNTYYRCGQEAKEDKPTGSAFWLLWRQECLIWKQLFPEEGFVGAEPKLKPTLQETETRNFSMMDSSKLWHILKACPDYERLTKDSDLVRSAPNGPSNLAKQLSHAMPSSSSAHERLESLQHKSQPSRTSGSIRKSKINFQPSQLIMEKAESRKVSVKIIVATYKEKQKLVQDHFPDEKEEWQRWFVEATVWGQLFERTPFPGSEPRFYHRAGDNGHIANPALDGNFAFSYTRQEEVMERMALKREIRREFFQYLNTTRHDAIAVHPLCTCYARHLFADRLTWRKFCKLYLLHESL